MRKSLVFQLLEVSLDHFGDLQLHINNPLQQHINDLRLVCFIILEDLVYLLLGLSLQIILFGTLSVSLKAELQEKKGRNLRKN